MPAMPAFQLATPKQMLRNLQTSAIAAIVFFAMMYATTKVEGGPVAYVACVTSCMAICAGATLGGFLPVCAATCAQYCAPAAIAPTP